MEDGPDVFQVVILGDVAHLLLVDDVENPANEGVLPTQEPQRISKLHIIHFFFTLADIAELSFDLLLLVLIDFELKLVVFL